jgi:S1-C subfamily serine protease
MFKKFFYISAALLLVFAACDYGWGDNDVKNSMVKILTISNSPSYYQPWQMKGQVASGGSGSIISGSRILTNAHVVSNTTFIQVHRVGGTENFTARVLSIDHDVDLAILTVSDKKFFDNSSALDIGNNPKQGDVVSVYGFPIGGDELSKTKGVVSRVEVSPYFHSYKNHLNVQLDAPINPGNSGGPVIKDGKIVGVAFQNYSNSDGIGYAIAPEIIRHFINDLKNKTYRGFPSLGFWWETIENKSIREMYGMSAGQSGIMVIRPVFDTSSWDTLKENDILLSIDGVNISNDGNVPLHNDGSVRVKFSYLIDAKYAGDKARLKILRDKKIKVLDVVLKKAEDIVPAFEYDVMPKYYIFGGLVFTKLTGNLLREWGDISKAPTNLASEFYFGYKTPEKQESVTLIQVLADETTNGYLDNSNITVTEVNGENIASLPDLIKKVENNKQKFIVFTLFDNSKIILDYTASKKANPGILAHYGIKSAYSDNMAAYVKPDLFDGVKGIK